jgi:ribosomal protein L11 methylase PrmA
MTTLIEGLHRVVDSLKWRPEGTEWAEYEHEHGYSADELEAKRQLVVRTVEELRPSVVWDLGANTGSFSRLAHDLGAYVVAIDGDAAAVERNYQQVKGLGEKRHQPLWGDLQNPTSSAGWASAERASLTERANADLVLALAVVHHLRIGGNVPLRLMSQWFAQLAPHLLIEFVPKDDAQVARLLVSREDVFDDYTQRGFERAFETEFSIVSRDSVGESGRVVYVLSRRGS